jgi:DMSO/TMAO reductase YedYZ molybdopterin-dependent catalytic subunit
MKSYKMFSILLILIIVFSLSITGCSPEPEVNAPENQEEDTSSDQEDEDDNELSEDDKQEESEKDNKELEESENEKTDAEKDQTEENKALEESDNSEEANDENENQDETREEATEEDSESEDSSSDDTTTEEVSSENEENNQEEINLLKIEGNVENSLSLSLEDLKAMEDYVYSGTFYSLNSFGTTEYTDFTGVKLWDLLKEKALISEEATGIQVVAVDGYSMEFTVEQIKRNDYIDETNQDLKLPVIIAWKENGEEYNPEDGPPYKLVIGQKEPGDVNKPQWVRDIDKIIVE